MGVKNGRLEGMQEGNKGVRVEGVGWRKTPRSRKASEKRCATKYVSKPKDDKKEGNGRWERQTRKHTHNYSVAVISTSV